MRMSAIIGNSGGSTGIPEVCSENSLCNRKEVKLFSTSNNRSADLASLGKNVWIIPTELEMGTSGKWEETSKLTNESSGSRV